MEANNIEAAEAKKGKSRTAQRISKRAVIILFLIFFVAVLAVTLSAGYAAKNEKAVVINEVVSSNSQQIPSVGSPDWIELYNPSKEDIDLLGYNLTNGNDRFTFGDTVIKAGGYLVVYAVKDGVSTDPSIICANFNISSRGDSLYLTDPQGSGISEVKVPALATDESYARRQDGTYGFCTNATPGEQNDDSNIMTEQQLENEIDGSDIVVSEVLPKGSDGESWVELYNRGAAAVNMDDFCLTDTQADPSKWHITKSTLDPGKYAVIYMANDEQDPKGLHAPFSLSSKDVGIYLYDITGRLKSSIKWDLGISGGVSVIADNTYTVYATMGEANSTDTFNSLAQTAMDDSDPVRINEVLVKNKYCYSDKDGNRYGWVELYNKTSKAVSLKGYFLSDDKNDLFRWQFPDTAIPSGGYITVFLTGEKDKQQVLHASFVLSAGETAVYLTNANGIRVDTMTLPETPQEDISIGRDSKGGMLYYSQPTPGEVNEEGQTTVPKYAYANRNGVYISEVMAASKAKSGANDWIELHNGSDSTASLKGYYLSDEASNIRKYKITSASIKAGGYIVIYASSVTKDPDTADFGISPSGETLFLSDPNGVVVDVFETGTLSPGITSGRLEDGSTDQRVYFTDPTPGKPNSTNYYTGYVSSPGFSESGLYHTQPFQLSITCSTAGAKVYYTTDGSVPSSSSKLYTGPITISANTPIRAIGCADGFLNSEIAASTYIFDSPHTVPVVCINGEQSEMNFLLDTNSREKPEYATNVGYYEKDGTLGVSFPAGVRPKGKASLALPQNSLTVALRSDYGEKSVTYPFFPSSDVTTFTTIDLRSSGQDSLDAKIRDSFFQTISRGMDVTSIYTRPVVLYVNGKYSGLYDLNEDQNSGYMESHYGIQKSNLDFINVFRKEATKGDIKEWQHIESISRTWDLSDDSVFADFSKYVDIDAVTDYLVAQTYFGNGDATNQRYFRARDYSVKWTPVLFDLDFSLRDNNVNRDSFSAYFTQNPYIGVDQSGKVLTTHMAITWALKKNKAWCDKFVERFVQLAETQYAPDRILPIYDSMISALKPEMAANIARYHTPSSMAYWQSQVSLLREAISKRRDVALKQLQQYFDVSNDKMQELIKKYSAQT